MSLEKERFFQDPEPSEENKTNENEQKKSPLAEEFGDIKRIRDLASLKVFSVAMKAVVDIPKSQLSVLFDKYKYETDKVNLALDEYFEENREKSKEEEKSQAEKREENMNSSIDGVIPESSSSLDSAISGTSSNAAFSENKENNSSDTAKPERSSSDAAIPERSSPNAAISQHKESSLDSIPESSSSDAAISENKENSLHSTTPITEENDSSSFHSDITMTEVNTSSRSPIKNEKPSHIPDNTQYSSLFIPEEENSPVFDSENQEMNNRSSANDTKIVPPFTETTQTTNSATPIKEEKGRSIHSAIIQEQPKSFTSPVGNTTKKTTNIIASSVYDKNSHSVPHSASSSIEVNHPPLFVERNESVSSAEEDIDIVMQDSLPSSQPEESSNKRDRQPDMGALFEIESLENRLKRMRREHNWKRFIGTMDVQAWTTRPLFRNLDYGSRLNLKRLIPTSSKKNGNKFGSTAIVRLMISEYTRDGYSVEREIGRIPEDLTAIFSPLMDLKLIKFEVSIILCDKKLSIGDSFYIQIDCFLTLRVFEEMGINTTHERALNSMKRTSIGSTWKNSETEAEAALRLRQSSIMKLFDRLHLKPSKKKGDLPTTNDDEEDGVINLDDEDDIIVIDDEPRELNLNQLKEFYKSNQQSNMLESLPEVEPPVHFNLTLRPYQKQGLSWMLNRERELDVIDSLSQSSGTQLSQAISSSQDEGIMNPLWREYEWPIGNNKVAENPEFKNKRFFYANIYSGELSMEKPIIKSICRGGILADEMGLGKTISTLSLIHSVPADSVFSPETSLKEAYAYKTTLIIVPMSLLSQWQKEFESSNTNQKNTCYMYYGTETVGDMTSLLCSENAPMVVLTTYGTVMNEWSRVAKASSQGEPLLKIGLFSVKFFRVVLDEGHTIRNRTAKTSKAIYDLKSSRKWVLTGTPVINRLDDIYSLVKFLELEPWSNFSYWKTFVTLPFEQRKIQQTLDVVKSILEPVVLRRTKNMKQKDGRPLVDLPSKEVVIEEIKFNDKEKKLYDWFLKRAEKSFKDSLASGEVLRRYTMILTHILRLRQVCCHMDLVGSANEMEEDVKMDRFDATMEGIFESSEPPKWSEHQWKQARLLISQNLDMDNSECSICTNTPIKVNEAAITECGHIFCLNCIFEHIDFQEERDNKPLCPNCRRSISKYRLFKVKEKKKQTHNKLSFIDPEEVDVDSPYELYLYDPDKQSSKIKALLQHLNIIKDQSPGEQVVVFSQFSTYLDIIEEELLSDSNDFIVYKFDGRLSMQERQRILEKFAQNEGRSKNKVTVLLLSLKAGGVGLNLTSASTAFMMDPWWSPSVEDQAIDRIHRIGQVNNVKVTRFIMENSIEKKMLKIQERKKQIGEAVGVEEEERRRRRIEEIQMLFEE